MTMTGKTMRWTITVVVMWAVALAGCAALQTSQAQSTEQLLSASGFRLKLADTPAKQAHLQTLMQRRIVPHDRKGKIYYVYADAANNRLYVGNEQAYQQFQALAVTKQIAQEQARAAALNADAAMNWDMWGPDPWD
jgi:cell division protein YceG involved in septum cleavage